ncbi:MAG: DUF423 domain-containing protein [Sphingobium sp.]
MLFVLGALSGALAIAAGAFGAHGAADPKAVEYLKTGGLYQMVHAVAVIVLAGQMRGPAWLLLAGAAIFAGTLYIMAVGGPRWLGAITPIGGTLMILGWLWAAWSFSRG